MGTDEVGIWWAWGWRVDIFSTLSHVVDGLTDSNIVQKLLLSGESPKHIVMLLPLQGATAPTRVNPGCRFACPGLSAPLAFQAALAKIIVAISMLVVERLYYNQCTASLLIVV